MKRSGSAGVTGLRNRPRLVRMSAAKTVPSETSVEAFFETVAPERKREEAKTLDGLFRTITGWNPVLWGSSMIGY